MSIFALSLIGVPVLTNNPSNLKPVYDSHTPVNIERLPDSKIITPPPPTISPEQQAYEAEKAKYLGEVQAQGLCVEWAQTALDAGWQPAELPRLMRIMHRESRCIPTACGETDSPHVRKCRDWGLMQINDYSWKRIIRSQGYHIEDMWDPYSNLKFARWLFEYSLNRNGDGWIPWKPVKQK